MLFLVLFVFVAGAYGTTSQLTSSSRANTTSNTSSWFSLSSETSSASGASSQQNNQVVSASSTSPLPSLQSSNPILTTSATARACTWPNNFDLRQAVYQGQICNRTGQPNMNFSPRPVYWEPTTSVFSLCWSRLSTDFWNWAMTAPISPLVIPAATVEGYPDGNHTFAASTVTESNTYVSPWYYYPSQPCCGGCTLFGGTVQIFHWPTPAPSPPVSVLVNTRNNFTL